MALETKTVTFDGFRAPATKLTREKDSVTGLVNYTAEVTIVGLSPTRSISSEEILDGIESLDPPTVTGRTVQQVVDRAILACANSYDSTVGYSLKPSILGSIAFSVRLGVAGAFRLLDVDA